MKLVQSTSLTMSSILLSYRWLLPAVFSTTNAATFASSDEANSLRLFWKFDDFPKVYTAIVPTGAPGDISGDDFVSSVDFLGVEEIITDEDGTRKAKVSFIVHDHWELMYVRYLARQNNVMFRGSKRSTKAASKIEVDDARTNDLHDELNYATNEEDSRVSRINEAYSTIGGYPCYKNVQGTFAWMNAMVERAASIPNLSVEIKDIGDSYLKSVDDSDGYDILAMVITGNGASSVQQKSIFFASTGIHAREYTPTELVSRWAEEDLINQYGVDVDITAMLDRTEIHLVIQANPDGRVLAETQKWQLRRKNANTKGRFLPCFLSTKGVDLNRNFPFRWDAPGGSSTNKCAQTYRGESPASEPETQAIVNYCKQIFPEGQRKQDPVAEKKEPYAEDTMGVFFDMHAYGEILIWPWSHENDRTANDEGFKALANKYKYFNDYAYAGPQEEAFLYEASGTTADWAYGVLGAAGMTFELGTSFYQQCDYFEDSILEKNKKALTYAAKISRAPYSLPKGPDIIDATLTVSSESSKEESLTISVSASDSSNTANAHSMAEQDVIEIRAFIDEHPYDLLEDGQSPEGIVVMEKASDGNSITVAGTKTIDISDLSGGKHVVYLIAKDSLSYSGPVTAYEFDKPAESAGCPELYEKEVINLDFNPAFLSFNDYSDGLGLTITSFYNLKLDTATGRPVILKPDLVARILEDEENESFSGVTVEILTDQQSDGIPGPPKTNWPNEAKLIPNGVFPFEALIISQGFHPSPFPGRLSAIDMSTLTEYIIQQSEEAPSGDPWFYHSVVFYDMDDDGLKDIITVRSGFRVGRFPNPPSGQLVWFKNPGLENIKPNVEWEERILVDGNGPDIFLKIFDFNNDGIIEIVGTHFFTGEKITIYGAPKDGKWSEVNALDPDAPTVRTADISTDQGKPFAIEIIDINGDGLVDIVASNHQSDNCPTFPDDMDGRVYVMEQPFLENDIDIFDHFEENGAWKTHILLKGIRPNPSMPGARASRAAPGNVLPFYPSRESEEEKGTRPWLLVGGDEASKVWILRPVENNNEDANWGYESFVVFDINDTYDPAMTQTDLAPEKPSVTISTIGKVAVRYDKAGVTEIYIPVFEAGDIYVYSFNPSKNSIGGPPRECLADVKIPCPKSDNNDKCQDGIASNPACIFGGICDCESLVNLPDSTGCGGEYASPMGMGEIIINDLCPLYCNACPEDNNANNDSIDGGETQEDASDDNTGSNEDDENSSDQDEENISNNNCEDKIASHPACTFGNICDCETLVNLPGSYGCGSILENPSGNLIINEWCPSYCNACPTKK